MPSRAVFEFEFTVDLHTAKGREIAKAAHAELRGREIDNEWKDTIGRGNLGEIGITIGRTNTRNLWNLLALVSPDVSYDRDAAARLHEQVRAALREHADEFKEYPSELYQPDQ